MDTVPKNIFIHLSATSFTIRRDNSENLPAELASSYFHQVSPASNASSPAMLPPGEIVSSTLTESTAEQRHWNFEQTSRQVQ